MPEQTLESNESGAVSCEEYVSEPTSAMLGLRFLDILTVLALHKGIILKVAGIGMVIGVAISLLLPTRYTAAVKILPPKQTQSEASLMMGNLANSNMSSLAPASTGGISSLFKGQSEIYLGLLSSRPIADSLIHDFDLVKVYHVKDSPQARKELAQNTKVSTDPKSGFIAVSVSDRDKERSAKIANAYIDQLRHITQTLAVTEASQRRLFYEGQLKRTQEDLVAAEYSFLRVQNTKGLIQPDTQAKALITSLVDLQARVASKQVELQALRAYSTESNPSVQLAENELSTLRQGIHKVDRRSDSEHPSDLGIEDISGAGMEYLHAEHELNYQQTLFELLIKQYNAARLDEAKEATVIQVVEPAIPPNVKSSPLRALIVFIASLMGFLAACVYVVVTINIRRDPVILQQIGELKSALRLRAFSAR